MRGRAAVMVVLLAELVAACGEAEPGAAVAAIVDSRLTIEARGIFFTPAEVTMTANTALTVVLDNQDAGIPHDAVLYGGPGFGTKLAATEIVPGVAQSQFTIPPIVPGRYRISCTVHPNMTATLTVIPPG